MDVTKAQQHDKQERQARATSKSDKQVRAMRSEQVFKRLFVF